MRKFALAGLCAGLLAAPLVARAADYVLVDQAGHSVAVVVPIAQQAFMPAQMGIPNPAFPMEIGFPVANIFAQEDAMIRHMTSDFSALPTMGEISSGAGPDSGSMITISSFTSGNGLCSRTVVYRGRSNSAAPLVHVSQTGDACGALPSADPRATVPVAEPETQRLAPRALGVPGGTKLYQIDYRHRKVAAPAIRG